MEGIDRKSSIESEPLTLGTNQMQIVRGAADNVLSSNTAEEASIIFTKDLKPTSSIKEQHGGTLMDYAKKLDITENEVPQISSTGKLTSAPF